MGISSLQVRRVVRWGMGFVNAGISGVVRGEPVRWAVRVVTWHLEEDERGGYPRRRRTTGASASTQLVSEPTRKYSVRESISSGSPAGAPGAPLV